jgi:putative peptidoglycan lipid II flippase
MSEHRAIFKSATILSVFTVISRITGFVRDVLLANIFGTGAAAQAFFVAFKIPNMFRDVMGEGAGNAAFVPVFCEELAKRPRQDFNRLVNTLMMFLLLVSCCIVVLGIIFSPVVVRLMAPGFFADRLKFDLTVALNRLVFPYLILITLSAYLASVANALKSFAVPASSSTVFNIVLILALVLIGGHLFHAPPSGVAYLVSIAVLIAGAAQVAIQFPSLWKKGINFKPEGFDKDFFKGGPVRKIGRLIFPRIIGTSIYQMNVFVDTIFASLSFFVGDGAIAAIYYANRIIQFPFSVFGVSLSNAALPTMSASFANKDMEQFKATLSFSLKTVFICIIPLTAGILVFVAPLVRAIFERGHFDAHSSFITIQAVFFYAWGLLGYVGVRFFSHAFYALQDTTTPVKTSGAALCSNIVLNSLFVFVFKMGISGLALASSISALMNFGLLHHFMNRRIGFKFDETFNRVIVKSMIASLFTVAFLSLVFHRVFAARPSLVDMFLVLLCGGIVYAILLWFLKVEEVKKLLVWFKKR